MKLMRLIDEQYTRCPFYGSRRITKWLVGQGHEVTRKLVQRLLRIMGLEAIYPKPKLSAGICHTMYPYLRRGRRAGQPVVVVRHLVRAAARRVHLPGNDDRLVQPVRGRLEVVEHARRVFLQEMLEEALGQGTLEVFNTDQEVQFTADARTRRLKRAGVSVSMDGRGRCLDKVFVERLWISVNYEDMYLKGYEVMPELEGGLRSYMGF